jgi:hypothetical protein
MKKILCSALAFIGLACASCADSTRLYPVSGTATYKGKPAAGAAVFFRRQGRGTMRDPMIMGIVQDDGGFELVCGSLGKGAPAGEYDVLIEWKRVTGQRKGGPQHGSDILKGRYADRNHPLLHTRVQARATNLPPFELRDAGPVQKR